MDNVIIIDGNNLLYRCLKVFSRLSYDGKSTSMIYGFPNVLRALVKQLKAEKVYVVFDGDRSAKRLEVLPEYKGSRKKDKKNHDYKDFERQKKSIMKLLKILKIPTIHVRGWEADDIIWLLARRLKRNQRVIIVSNDKDFDQLIGKNLTTWNPSLKKRLTPVNLFKIRGYYPEETVDWLIFMGDTSDNIPGLKGMGAVGMRKFLDKYGSIKKYLKNPEPLGKFELKVMEETFLRNRQLIDIRLHVRREKATLSSLGISLKGKKGKIKKKKLNEYIAKYGLTSLSNDSFYKTFNKLKR